MGQPHGAPSSGSAAACPPLVPAENAARDTPCGRRRATGRLTARQHKAEPSPGVDFNWWLTGGCSVLVSLPRLVFDSLDDAALAWACVEPTIRQIRGRSPAVKAAVYAQLTAGQRALLIYGVLRGHSQNGVAQFFGEVGYLVLYVDVWSALRSAMTYFGDDDMRRAVEEMAELYGDVAARPHREANAGFDEALGADPRVAATARRLDSTLAALASSTLARVGARIRSDPDEFARIAD